jgi:hypothetical protein
VHVDAARGRPDRCCRHAREWSQRQRLRRSFGAGPCFAGCAPWHRGTRLARRKSRTSDHGLVRHRRRAWCGIGAAMSVPRWCCSSFWPNRWRDEDQARVSSAVLTGQQARLACIGQPWFGRYQTNPRSSSSDGLRTSARIAAFRAVITQDPHPCPAAKVRAVNCSATGTASGARDSAGTCVLAIGERRRVAAGPRCARFGWLVPLPQKVPERAFLKLDSWGGWPCARW